MKKLVTYFSKLFSPSVDLPSSDVSHDRRLAVGSPSGFSSKSLLRLVSVTVLVFTISVGSAWSADPTLADLSFSTSNSVRIINEDFNGCSTSWSRTSTVANTTSQSDYGVFNYMYNNNTSNKYGIQNAVATTGFSSNCLSLYAGSGSPVQMFVSGKTFGNVGAWRLKTTKTSYNQFGIYKEKSNNAITHADTRVHIQNNKGTISISSGSSWTSVKTVTTDIIDICVIYNKSGSSTTYGNSISIANNTAHIYINGECVMNGSNPKAFSISSTDLTSSAVFKVLPQTTSGNYSYVDDIQVWNALPTAAASCASNPTVTAASSNGSITSTSIPVQCASGISNIGGTGCSLTDYGFVWKTTSAAPDISTDTKHSLGSSIAASTAFNYTITGLSPNTPYYIYAYATNGHGTGYSSVYNPTTLQRYAISYNNNGGSNSMDGAYKDHGVNFALPANAGSMTKTGYHATGWLLGSSSGTHYDLSGSYTTNAAATFYVEWTANTYQVAFDKNGGTGSMSNETGFTYGESKALTTCAFTAPADKYFLGWNTDKNATTALYTDGQSVSNLTSTHNGTVTLYAIWKDHTFTNYRTSCGCTAPDHVTVTPTTEDGNYGWRYSVGETLKLTATPYDDTDAEITSGITGYQWQKYVGSVWTDLVDGGSISGATTANLQISNVTTSNGGSYRCNISTGATCTTSSDGYFVRIFTLYGGYSGGDYSHNTITWTTQYRGTVTINLNAGSSYKFKFTDNNGRWFGNGGTITKDFATENDAEWGFGTSAGDATLTTGSYGSGNYVFTVDITHFDDGESKYVNLRSVVYPTKTTYLQLCSDWKAGDAKYAVYYWNGGNNGWTDFMEAFACDGDIRYVEIPVWAANCIFGRFNPSKVSTGDWTDVYNQTGDLALSSSNDYYHTLSKGGDHKYYGTWGTYSPSTYTITFAGNGSDGGSAMSNVTSIPCGEDRTLVANTWTKTGHTFSGWKTDVAITANSSAVAANGIVADESTINSISQNITLTAQWTPNNHTLAWELNGGSISVAGTTAGTVAYGTSLTAPTVTKTGYTFNVWSPSVPATMPDADATYTATWTANTYQVRFNRNGGTGGSDMSNQNFTYDVAQNLSTCTFTHATKSFGGWTTNSDGTGDEYANGASVSNLSSTQGAVVDLYAKWVDCDLYTVTLNVNGNAWKTWTQGSCGASIDLSSYQDVPSCGGGYTLVGWSTTNSGISTTVPTITKTSSYTPEANTTLYAVYSYSAKIGTKVMNLTGFGGSTKPYILVANNSNVAMKTADDTVHVAKSATGDALIVTSSNNPKELYFSDAGSSKWFIYSPYKKGSNEYFDYEYYYAPSGSGGQLSTYDDADYDEWYIDFSDEYTGEDDIKSCYYGDCYYDYDEIESFMKANGFTNELWSVSVNGTTGVATITAVDAGSNTRTWYYKSQKTFKTYSGSTQSAVALYEYNPSGTAYTTQPSMTYYTISKGSETNGTYTISQGVVCSGGSVSLTATPDDGYAFNGWTSSNGGSFSPNASTASATYTIGSGNTTLTASFVAVVSHDITWMVNGSAYTTGTPTSSLTGGTSFSTMTLPTAPANNTLSSACSAVANQFVGWSKTDMGFATGQSAPTLFTNAAGAGTAYGTMGDEDVTFYAVFAQDGSSNYMSRCPNTYTITLDDNGDYGGNGSATATEKGTSLTINSTPTRLGYSVEGYYKEVGTTTKVATDAGALQNGSGSGIDGWTNSSNQFIGTSDGTLYTKWNIVTYNLTYENLNGASNSNPATYQVTTATIVLADPGSRTGYTFAGWTCGGDAITQITLGSTGDKTITANWSANTYAITYKDKDDAAYSGNKTDGRPTGLPANHTYGTQTDLANGVKAGYRFDGWFENSACTGDPVTSIGATAKTAAFTLYAKWTPSYTFTFSKNGVVDGTLTLGQVEGGNLVMPNTTVDCGLWTTFEGWVEGDVAQTTTEPTMYKAGDVFVVPVACGDKTFKAVYSKHEGDATVSYEKVTSGHKSGTYIMVSSNDLVYTGQNSGSGTTDYGNNTAVTQSAGVVTSANLPSGAKEVTVRIGKGGSINNKFAMQIPSTKYLSATNGNYLNSDITDVGSAYVWQFDNGTDSYGKSGSEKTGAAGAIRSTTNTTRVIQPNGARFACYENTYTNYVFLYRKKVAGTTYYTTAPASCAVPTEITVSYNDNKSHAGDQTISGMPSGTTLDFTSYPDFDSYTVGAAPTDPTGYHFVGWNTSADGNGDDYTAGASVTTFGYRETITLYAKWERVYTVTLYDNGSLRTTLTQASAGATVTLPSGDNCTPSSEFTFEGWTESAVELNADPVRPASATLHAAGAWEPESDITLYSVYSRSVAGCENFAAGVSGAYKLYNKATNEYAIVTANANRYDKASSGTAEIFYIAYSTAKSAYTIRTSLGYLGWSGGSGSETLTKNNATPYYWDIKEGTSGNAGYWNFQPIGASTKQFSGNGTYFNFGSNSTKYYIRLEKNAMTYYYNTALCADAKITFHDGGGSISGTPTTPDGSSWNSSTHVLSGLEDCDKITTFPTASYDGWTFIGWSTEDYTNSGKHTEGTSQYAAENASTDEPDASIIYKTGGNPYVVRGGSIDLYPIFTRFPDNEPFDIESGGRYYMYYLDPDVDDGFGAPARRYAGAWDGTKRYTATTSCAEATEFEFTKSGDVWHIQNTANDKWLGGKSNDDWLIENNSLGTLTDWTITIRSGNQFNATCQSGRQIIVYDNFFMDYSSNNLVNNPGYYCVYLGSCEERIFSSEPHPTPILELSGEPYVTSSASQRVRATATMTLTAVNLTSVPATRVKVTGTNLTFATSATATPATPLWVDLVSGAATATIYVYYTPTATEDGLENVIVTAQAYNTNTPKDLQTTGTVHGRHLPANFVIAAKLGDNWYALPSTCNSSGSSTTGVLITVDNDSDPTSATYAPSTTKWGLRQTKQPSRITAGYADRLTFTERGTTATADNQQALYNYNSADIYTNGQWTNYANTNPGRYEWIPVTSDFKDYTLTNAEASKPLILRNDGEFKAQTTNQAYDGKVRLLPATFYEDNIQIVEWKTNSVVVMYTGSQTSATTKVGTNSEGSAQNLSTHKLTHGIYELTTGSSLTSNAGKNLVLKFGADVDKKMFEIPIIVNGSTNASTGHDKQDVVILKNGKLTAQSTKYSYRNIYVYGGGKLKIASGTSLGVNNIILRAGGITTSGIGSSPTATYDYVYPQVELGGTLTSTKTDIKYEYITDYDHWYHLCLPFGASLSSITYPVEYYGRNVTEGNTGSWIIKRYDGATRATGSYAAWKDIENDVPKPTTTTAGQGYIFWGAPKKVSVGGAAKERQKWGIQRMTMSIAAGAATSAETNDKNISVDSYSDVEGKSTKPNDQGWNLVGNPFMANLTGLTSESLIAGKLVHTDTDPWDGKWKNNGDGTRYVTIPDNHFDNYVAKTTSTASGAGDFMPGRTFFVQIAEGASTLTFATANRASLMPALYAKTEASTDIETGIVMSDETHHDEVNFWIKDGKTADYESNADYPKTPNGSNFNIYGVHEACDLSWIAISPEIAEGSMAIGYQVPTAGEYMLSLSETYVSDKIDHVFVTDHAMSPEITTDLMDGVYNFQVNQAETNNTRFTVSIQLKEEAQTPTDIDNVRGDPDKPTKFIYHDKIYILRGGQLYDATGKQVKGGLK